MSWLYKEASLTNQVNFPYEVSSLTGNFTLYAKWDDASPGTISITKQSLIGNCTYINISVYRLEGSTWVVVNNNVSTSIGTTNITVTPGTYYVDAMGFFLYSNWWSETPSFTISAGQIRRVNISCQVCGLVYE